jgi:alanine transaminase
MKSFKRLYSTSTTKKALSVGNINQHVVKAEYAVRGAIVTRAGEIMEEINTGKQTYPFKDLTECNIGNPQYFGQPPITFSRQVLSLLVCPELISSAPFHKDVKNRARYYLSKMHGGVGAYSESFGYRFVREDVAKFIMKRDNNPLVRTNPDDIILTDGASKGIQSVLSTIISKPNDGIMIPIPQYPLYSALITYLHANEVPYYLNEETGWQVTVEDLKSSIEKARAKGLDPRAITIINPGNPTGQVLTESTIRDIIKFAYENNLVILADEVYQENVYKAGKTFFSFKHGVSTMPEPYNQTELFSFHSISKGFVGECGLRGGYLEMTNIDPAVKAQIQKLQTIFLCSNTTGQIGTDLMINPPNAEMESAETVEQYQSEKNALLTSLKRRAVLVTEALNKMTNITCNEVEGAMYAFPKVELSQKAITEAKERKIAPDMFYALKALEKTGVVIVPGSGFRQKDNTHHFRITTLILPEEKMMERLKNFQQFNDWFHKEYKDTGSFGFSGATPKVKLG